MYAILDLQSKLNVVLKDVDKNVVFMGWVIMPYDRNHITIFVTIFEPT